MCDPEKPSREAAYRELGLVFGSECRQTADLSTGVGAANIAALPAWEPVRAHLCYVHRTARTFCRLPRLICRSKKAAPAVMTLTHGARRLPRVEVMVCLKPEDADDLSKADIDQFELWRHGDEKLSRDEAINSLIGMLKRLIKAAKKDKLELAPFTSASAVQAASTPTVRSKPADRIYRAIGRAAHSICPSACTRPSPRSAAARQSSCTTMPSCRA